MSKSNVKDRVLVRMLSHLSRKQLRSFKDYLSSNLFTTNKSLLVFVEYLEKKALKAPEMPLNQADLVKDTGFSNATTEKLFSQTLSLLNSFVAWEERKKDPGAEYAYTFQAWQGMGLEPELLERAYRKMKRQMGDEPASDVDIYHGLRLHHRYLQFQAGQPRKKQGDLFGPHLEMLDTFYLVSKLKYLCGALSAGRVFSKAETGIDLNLDVERVEKLPAIGKAYFKAYNLLLNPSPEPEEAQKLFDFVNTQGQHFELEDRSDLYGFLLNCSFRGFSKGILGFGLLADGIYNAMLTGGLLTATGHMPGGHFKNIVSVKVQVGKAAEAREFIEEHQELLLDSERSTLVTYTRGIVHFYFKEYREAMSRFRKIVWDSAEDLFWGLEARNMLWKSYFEAYDDLNMDEHEDMLKLYHSFRVFVSRNSRISDYHKTSYLNFIRVFNRLIHVGDDQLWVSTIPELQALSEETKKMEQIVHKRWIVEAIERKIQRLSA